MKAFEHLTKEQIQTYADYSVAPVETDAIENHLLQCATCRDLLPAPTPEQFWSALLLDEPEREESFETEKLSPVPSSSSTVFSFFQKPFAWGAGAFVLIVGFSFLIWLGASKQSNLETDIAHSENYNSGVTIRTESPSKDENSVNANATNFNALPPINSSKPPRNVSNSNPNIVNNGQISGNSEVVVSHSIGVANVKIKTKTGTPSPQPKNQVPASNIVANQMTSDADRLLVKEGKVLRFPAALNRVIRRELLTLKGSTAEIDFDLISPVGTFIKGDSPTFVWQKAPGAIRYEIAVRSVKGAKTILNETTSSTTYKVPNGILEQHREQVLQWSVTAYAPDGTSRSTPGGIEPEALFMIIDRGKIADVEKKVLQTKDEPLHGAVILANEGLLDDAENEIKTYLTAHPSSKKARILLKQIQSWRNVKGQAN